MLQHDITWLKILAGTVFFPNERCTRYPVVASEYCKDHEKKVFLIAQQPLPRFCPFSFCFVSMRIHLFFFFYQYFPLIFHPTFRRKILLYHSVCKMRFYARFAYGSSHFHTSWYKISYYTCSKNVFLTSVITPLAFGSCCKLTLVRKSFIALVS